MIGNYYYGACDGFHFSDNYVTGDNIYLRELQNFFFEVLGMMSITHYGAIGDGRTDNYGPIQVAIDDANRRGLSYIYVPFGRFIYTGELINMDKVEFVGNPHAKILNIRTGEEIPIKQFGVETSSKYYTKAEVDVLLEGIRFETDTKLLDKQDRLIAGDGIEIDGNIISATTGDGQLFTHSQFPTTWGGAVEEQTDTGTNTYGTWTATTDATPNPESGTKISNAFDGDADTSFVFRCDSQNEASGTPVELEIEFPTGVTINPAQIHIKAKGIYDGNAVEEKVAKVIGYNVLTDEWEDLVTLNTKSTYVSGGFDDYFDISTSKYFTKIKLTNIYRWGATGGTARVTTFDIPIGKIKD